MGDVMHPLARTILQRLGLGLMTLFIVSIVIFSMVSWLPGDFAKAILGQAATEETVAAFQKEIGLDKPPVQRYVEWVGNVVQGEFGSSFASRVGYKRTVAELIAPRLANTLFLASLTAADVAVEPFFVNFTMSTESISPTRTSAASSSTSEGLERLLPFRICRIAASSISSSA